MKALLIVELSYKGEGIQYMISNVEFKIDPNNNRIKYLKTKNKFAEVELNYDLDTHDLEYKMIVNEDEWEVGFEAFDERWNKFEDNYYNDKVYPLPHIQNNTYGSTINYGSFFSL